MPKSPDVELLDQIHFIRLVGKKIPDFEVDPHKVHQVQTGVDVAADNSELQPTFRYIIALQGPGRVAAQNELFEELGRVNHDLIHDIVEAAKNRLHDRIKFFPSGEGNAIIPFTADYPAAAVHLLNLQVHKIKGQSELGYSRPEQKRIADLAREIKGDKEHHCKILIVRGSFVSREAFVEALNKALDHPHIQPEPHTPPLLTVHDGLSAVSVALEGTGKKLHKLLPNIPLAHVMTGSLVRAGQQLRDVANNSGSRHVHPDHRSSQR